MFYYDYFRELLWKFNAIIYSRFLFGFKLGLGLGLI